MCAHHNSPCHHSAHTNNDKDNYELSKESEQDMEYNIEKYRRVEGSKFSH